MSLTQAFVIFTFFICSAMMAANLRLKDAGRLGLVYYLLNAVGMLAAFLTFAPAYPYLLGAYLNNNPLRDAGTLIQHHAYPLQILFYFLSFFFATGVLAFIKKPHSRG